MNIGSRPAKRKAAASIDSLRAIPWIFAWTQTRFHLPVWLGVGEAFQVNTSHIKVLVGCAHRYSVQLRDVSIPNHVVQLHTYISHVVQVMRDG